MSKESLPLKQILSQLGIAMKAGKLVSGEFQVEKAVKEMKAHLVVIAEDASENTRKHFSDMCQFRQIPIRFFGKKEEIGNAIGKAYRASIAVTEKGFAESILRKVDAQ